MQAEHAGFELLVQFFAVVCFGEDRNVPKVERDGVRAVVAHGANQLAIAECVVPRELDAADLHLRPFLNFKNQDNGVARRDALILRRDFGKLAAVLPKQFLQDYFRFLDARGIKLALHREADLALLEAVENVGFRNRMNAVVANAANNRPLFNLEDEVLMIRAVRRMLDAKLYILKELRVPKSLEVAAQRFFVIRIAIAAENAGFERVAANPAIANEDDAVDDRSDRLWRRILERRLGVIAGG